MIKFRTKTSSFTLNLILLFFLCLFFSPYIAFAGNITPTAYAWSSELGWVNFSPDTGNVSVSDSAITGYAWSAQSGWINFTPSQGGVRNNGGVLSGYAWGEGAGWVNFSGVIINTSTGVFSGQATGDVVGTLNFSCSQCHVATTWRPSSSHSGSSGYISLLDFSPNTGTSSSRYSWPSRDVIASDNGDTAYADSGINNFETSDSNSSFVGQQSNQRSFSTTISKKMNLTKFLKFTHIFGYPTMSVIGSILALVLLGWLISSIVRRGRFQNFDLTEQIRRDILEGRM